MVKLLAHGSEAHGFKPQHHQITPVGCLSKALNLKAALKRFSIPFYSMSMGSTDLHLYLRQNYCKAFFSRANQTQTQRQQMNAEEFALLASFCASMKSEGEKAQWGGKEKEKSSLPWQ